MKAVFADTSLFLALTNSRDQHHRLAVEMRVSLAVPLVTTEWVLLEYANAICGSRSRLLFAGVVADLRGGSDAKIVSSDPALFEHGCALYASRPDKDWSLTDCISFLVMKEEELTDALTTDHHFKQAGFNALLIQ